MRASVWILGAGMLLACGIPYGEARAQGSVAPTPQQQGFTVNPEYSCVVCHTEKRRAFRFGVHSERGIRCHDCHGGDPRVFETETAHIGGAFIGSPSKIETIQMCGTCHSDPDQMRQYGLPADQLAEFRTSRHGMLLLDQGDNNAPTCTDCHDAHTILPANDARSNVHPTNIVETCSVCHEDAAMMSEYGLPIDQITTHRSSAHGVALYEELNFAAPTCTGCHGSHAALPPNVDQITDVCGQCHVLVRRALDAGPHGVAARNGLLPGCTACHSNHGTERVPPDEIAATCTECHDADSPAALVGIEIQEEVIRSTEDLHSAEEAISELRLAGHRVAEVTLRYHSAQSANLQISQTQHSLDLETLEDLTRQVASISADIRATAEVAAEHQWEHKLLLVPIWFLALSAITLAWFKLRSLERRE